jgi:hypothetical protein
MKAKDIRTLKSLISEYGMSSGASTPTSQQKTGSTAKATAAAKPPKSSVNKPQVSPSSQQNKTDTEQPAPVEPTISKAKELAQDFEYQDDKGDIIKVVSPVDNGLNKDAVVVQNQKSKEFFTLNPDDDITLPGEEQEVSEGKLGKMLTKRQKKSHIGQKIKRLTREHKRREQGDELLFEINFNSQKLAKEALVAPIKCGFEAETSWENIYGGSDDDEGDWLYEYNWYDIEDFVADQDGRGSVDTINDAYDEWISEQAMDLESDIVWEIVSEREEDEVYLNDYIDQELDEDDIREYKENQVEDMDDDQLEEFEDWDFMAWGRQYVEEELLDEYKEWLADGVRDEGEAMERAYDDARDSNSIDDWASNEYGSWSSCLSEFGIYLYNPNGGGGLEEVSAGLEDWMYNNSKFNEVQVGEYHSTSGGIDYWRVEDDSSIDSGGTGAEIISPVYSTPKEMLGEMKSLFEWLEEQGAETNSSTGLHVTMSLDSEEKEDINDVKLAVLLGDKYLLSTFGREGNSYAKSQMDNLKRMASELKRNPDSTKTIKGIEEILKGGISRDKFSAINFKQESDKETGNQLIEFRIGGGNDYHNNYNTAVKAIVRYAATLTAAYSDKMYNDDYVKALFRMISKLDTISPDDEERVKSRTDVEHPAIDVLKGYFSKENYVNSMYLVASAFNTLEEYKKLSAPGADKKWKQSVKDFEKGTGTKLDGLEEDETTTGYIQPSTIAPSKQAEAYLKKAQNKFARAIAQAGYDISQNLNRATINAKGIGVLRKTLPEFKLTVEQLGKIIITPDVNQSVEIGRNPGGTLTHKERLSRIKNGSDRLFKKTVVVEPDYLTAAQTDRIVQGLWNAVHAEDGLDKEKLADLIDTASPRVSKDYAGEFIDKATQTSSDINSQYKIFHKRVISGGYDYQEMFEPGMPIMKKELNKLQDYIKKFPQWEHAVSRDHNPDLQQGQDSYIENAMSKMLQKMRLRWEHLEDVRQDQPAKYYDSMKVIADLAEKLVKQNKAEDNYMVDNHPQVKGTRHEDVREGPAYFAMSKYAAETLENAIDEVRGRPDAISEPVAHRFRNTMQDYLRSSYERYYDKKKGTPDYYDDEYIQKLIGERTTNIKNFLEGFDKIAQEFGFDSQQTAIDKKKKLDVKQDQFKKKHGSPHIGTLPVFKFGGSIFVSSSYYRNLKAGEDMITDRDIAQELQSPQSKVQSRLGNILSIPTAHYHQALVASDILANDAHKGTWREKVAMKVLRKFQQVYDAGFSGVADESNYININSNDGEIKNLLKQRNVKFEPSLGDGREGMGQFKPLLPSEEAEGPYGEPLDTMAAASWHVNNPELSKKAKADQEKQQKAKNAISGMVDAADVEGLEGASSNGVANSTNWGNLADYLKIERGVGNQGVNLLQKVYDQFDSNHNWRPDNEKAIGTERWAAAVKAAKEYIEKNYKVSGGNYFRLNADGSLGDDVSTVHSSEADAQAQRDRIRRMSKESTFNKFDKLPLEEQLNLLNKVDSNKINEAYKKKGKGFEHPNKSGKKAKYVEGAVPDNSPEKKIQELLNVPLLASDLKAQMEAYFVVPDPSMIRAFREAASGAGPDTDLRSIFKGFVQNKVHPTIKQKAGLKESMLSEDDLDRDKERFNFIIDKLKDNPAFIQRVYRFMRTDAENHERVHPEDFLKPEKTAPEADYSYKGVLPEFVKAIMNTKGDFDDIENFLSTYGQVSYVDTKVLMADGASTWDQWLKGAEGVSTEFITELYDNLFNIALNIEGSNRGPGEVGLALLAPNITFASVGDLKIDGVEVEVKGEKSSGGGRLKNSNADYGQPQLDAVYDKFKIAPEDRPQRLPSGNAGSRAGTHFLDIATQLDTLAAGAGKAYIQELFTATFKYGDKSMINYMIANYTGMDRADASTLAGEISYSSYANILKEKGFSMFLFLKLGGKKSLAFDVDDYKNHLDKFKLGSLDWGDKMNGPAVQVSMR